MKYFSVDDQIRIVNSAVLKASMSAVFDAVNQHIQKDCFVIK